MSDARPTAEAATEPSANQLRWHARIPRATYRIQLRSDFGLAAVRNLLSYLNDLGVSDVYLSPLFRARDESSHGYDVVDHNAIDPAFGTLEDFQGLAESTRDQDMGILLDVVPNHMGVNDPANRWWFDVLEHGEHAEHAHFFDIDWQPSAAHLRGKVLLPFLGAPFGETLESGQLRIVYEKGRLAMAYGPKRYPLARTTWPEHLAQLVAHAPNDNDTRIAGALADLNGHEGDPRSFDALEHLVDAQPYRLAYWRVASDEINYRRFFDINDLAAIRVEDPRVFDEVHRLVARFLQEGWVTGLRIDHPDGLLDPEGYFGNLQALCRVQGAAHEAPNGAASSQPPLYVVAEKILSGDEPLPTEWRISGTTGYDFLNHVSRVLVRGEGLSVLRSNYERLTDHDATAAETAYESKREVLQNSLASELNVLAGQLDRIARQHRASRDFTRPALQRALREVIACLLVYRTYVRPRGWDVGEADFRHVTTAVRWAKRRNAGASHSVFEFLGAVLKLENPPTLSPEQAEERRRFALKFQQVTGPAMAKGLEDTAFYRYYPLASLNEVGGELDAHPLAVEEFHRLMTRRASEWPHSMSASSTHDTKRGEDFRARLHVLSEVPEDWVAAVENWLKLVRPLLAEVEGEPAPDRNELYLLFQTLVGTWPVHRPQEATEQLYADRLVAYMQKAMREAKVHTSWISPSEPHEQAMFAVIRAILTDQGTAELHRQIGAFAERIAPAGYVNGLSQLLLKATLPGVPDFYQGGEYWDFNLVDPDNRRPVDFDARRRSLSELSKRFAEVPDELSRSLGEALHQDAAKQFVTWRALATRRQHAEIFKQGAYQPLNIRGELADRAVAFARQSEAGCIAVVVPRQIQCLLDDHGSIPWGDAAVELPSGCAQWRDMLGDRLLRHADNAIRLADLLQPLPLALLASHPS